MFGDVEVSDTVAAALASHFTGPLPAKIPMQVFCSVLLRATDSQHDMVGSPMRRVVYGPPAGPTLSFATSYQALLQAVWMIVRDGTEDLHYFVSHNEGYFQVTRDGITRVEALPADRHPSAPPPRPHRC